MDLKLDVYHHFADLTPMSAKLDQILTLLQQQGVTLMADFAALQQQVQANTDVEQSAIVLLEQLHGMLVVAQQSGDPAQLQSVIDQLGASKAALASAVEANTPASA